MNEVRATHVVELVSKLGQRRLRRVSLDADGRPLLLTVEGDHEGREVHRIEHQLQDGTWLSLVLEPPDNGGTPRLVQAWNDGFLVISNLGRELLPSDHNAHIYDAAGRERSSFHAGSHIRDVQASPSGQIWLSFSDQGVADSLGHSMSTHALVQLDNNGRLLTSYRTIASEHRLIVGTPDALNIAGDDDVWMLFRDASPQHPLRCVLVNISSKGGPRSWNVDVALSYALALSGSYVVFAGDTRYFASQLLGVSLGYEKITQAVPIYANGEPIDFSRYRSTGRGSVMLLNDGQNLYKIGAESVKTLQS